MVRERLAGDRMKSSRPDTFYHGTSVESAVQIQAHGFKLGKSGSGPGLMGKGVYCSSKLAKAVDYANRHKDGGIVFEVQCDLGLCKTLMVADPMMQSWQDNGYDSAWAREGANHRDMTENCIKNPERISIVRAIAGDTGRLKASGMFVRSDGRLSMLADRTGALEMQIAAAIEVVEEKATEAHKDATVAASGQCVVVPLVGAKRKYESAAPPMEDEVLVLLNVWKLQVVANELAQEGITTMQVILEELPAAEISKIAIGIVYRTRLTNLVRSVRNAHADAQKKIKRGLILLLQMRASHATHSVHRESCFELSQLLHAETSEHVLDAVFDGDIMPILFKVMAEHSAQADVQWRACGLILALSRGNKKHAMIEAGVLPILLDSMSKHAQDEHVQMSGVRALYNFTQKSNGIKKRLAPIVEAGGIRVILAAMQMHSTSESVQQNVCGILCQLAAVPEYNASIVDASGIRTVITALSAKLDFKRMQEFGLHFLETCITRNDKNRSTCIAAGLIQMLVRSMKAHATFPLFQRQCAHLLVQLSLVDGEQKEDPNKIFSSTAAAAGVIPAIMSLMQIHTGHAELIVNLLAVLNCASMLVDNRKEMVEAGSIGIVLRAVQKHIYNPIACAHACLFLRNFSRLVEYYPDIVAADGIALFVGIIKTHPALMRHQVQSISVLFNIALLTPASSLLICNAGGVQALMHVMKTHIHAKVNYHGCLLLIRLALSKEACAIILTEGGVGVVLESMAKYRDDVSIQLHACCVLHNLLMHGENAHAMIVEQDGITVLLAAMQTHAHDTNTTSKVLGILNQLQFQTKDHSNMVAAGGIPLLIAVTVQHPGVVGTHDTACKLLISIAHADPVHRQACKDGGVVAVLCSAITQEGFDDEFKESARKIIDSTSMV